MGERSWAFTRIFLPPLVLLGAGVYAAGVVGGIVTAAVGALWTVWMMGRRS